MAKERFIKNYFIALVVAVTLGVGLDACGMCARLERVLVQEKLLSAIAINKIDGVLLALRDGADINAIDENGDTPLYKAVCAGYIHVVGLLLELGADIDAINSYDNSALHGAVRAGHEDIAKMLIKKGARVNEVNMYGSAPLHYAVKNNYTEVVVILMSAGADIHCIDGEGETVFELVVLDMLSAVMNARAAMAKENKAITATKRVIADLPIMLAMAVGAHNKEMVVWLLQTDSRAEHNGGICNICLDSFVKRVLHDGVELRRMSHACFHLVCDECEQELLKAAAACDIERERGVYEGRDAEGNERWAFPGQINVRRCPECRAEYDAVLSVMERCMPSGTQLRQFYALRDEFQEAYLAHGLSCMLKSTEILRQFVWEKGVVALVDDYAAIS